MANISPRDIINTCNLKLESKRYFASLLDVLEMTYLARSVVKKGSNMRKCFKDLKRIFINNYDYANFKSFKKYRRSDGPFGITLGNFDGFHLGHLEFLNFMQRDCKKLGLTPVIITFNPHPRLVLDSTKPF